jgi:hypothetical protein
MFAIAFTLEDSDLANRVESTTGEGIEPFMVIMRWWLLVFFLNYNRNMALAASISIFLVDVMNFDSCIVDLI